MNQKMVFGILIAAILFFCFILVVELKDQLKIQLGWMVAGFAVTAVAGFILLYIKFTPAIILGTLGIFGTCYIIYKVSPQNGVGLSASVGAIAAAILLSAFQFGWMKKTGYSDYVKDQKAIFEKEQSGGQSYAQQQQALYDEKKGQGGEKGPGQG